MASIGTPWDAVGLMAHVALAQLMTYGLRFAAWSLLQRSMGWRGRLRVAVGAALAVALAMWLSRRFGEALQPALVAGSYVYFTAISAGAHALRTRVGSAISRAEYFLLCAFVSVIVPALVLRGPLGIWTQVIAFDLMLRLYS